MWIEVLPIYSNIDLGRKLGKSLKIAKGQRHNPDKTGHCHPQFKACFSMVTHGNETQIGLRNSLRSDVHLYRRFHEDTMKGISSDHTAKLPKFCLTRSIILNSKFHSQPRLLWSLSLISKLCLLSLSGFIPRFGVSHCIILLPEPFTFLNLCLRVHLILNILVPFPKIFQLCIAKKWCC